VSEPGRIAAIVPVAAIEGAKTRLGETLDAEERHDLVEGLVARTLAAVESVARIDDVLVISPDRTVLDWATDVGARTLRQRTSGLNAGVREARDDVIAGGADAVVIVPIDLPFITMAALDDLIGALFEDPGPTVVLVPDRHGTGTNALALRPPHVIDVSFGSDSRAAHREAAATAGVAYREVDGPLSVDLDTPEDLVLVDTIRAEGSHVG
jgi:2-phospho-L-lactate guanylyltransferase